MQKHHQPTDSLSAICRERGSLEIQGKNAHSTDRFGFVTDGGLEHYSFADAQQLYDCAREYDYINRGANKIERGANYTLRKAQNDFDFYMKDE